MRDDRELDRLIAGHLDDALGAADAAALHQRLRDEPRARELLLASATQATALPQLAGRKAARRAMPRLWLLAAAAGLAVALGTLAWLSGGAAPVLRLDGAADGGSWLKDGDTVRSGTSPVVLSWAGEATRIDLEPGGELRVERDRGGKRLHLLRGRLRADVAHQAPGDGLFILTPHGQVEVVGTRFDVAVTAGASAVSVDQGTVRVSAAGAAAPVAVEAGFDVRLDGVRPPVPSPRMILPAAPVAGDGRRTVLGPADWIAVGGDGWEGGLGDGCITSIMLDERVARIMPPFRQPPGHIGYGDDLACTITVAVDRPTTLALVLVLDRGDGRGWLGNAQEERQIPAGTSTVTYRLKEMRRVKGFEIEPGPGACVNGLAVMTWMPRTEMRLTRIELDHRP